MTDFPLSDFPDNDAAQQSGDMFLKPVPVPTADIDSAPLICVQFNEEYAAIFALALQRLTYYDAWIGDDELITEATIQIDHFIGELLNGNCP